MADGRIPMGIGALGFRNTIFKRKFRYTFEVGNVCGGGIIPAAFVKLAARPSLSIEETEINFLNAKTWIPGKATWESINVTYIDAVDPNNPQYFKPLFDWLASVYNFTNFAPDGSFNVGAKASMGANREQYGATGILRMYDGCGTLLERWTLNDMWPTSVNFGDLDYSNSEEATIELTLRYSDVTYEPMCPSFPINPCCVGCN